MALTTSHAATLGALAPTFDLPVANPSVDDAGEARRSLDDYADAPVLVVVFTCNHCPYAKHVEDALIRFAHDHVARGVQVVAISPNDPEQYPDDSFERMAERAEAKRYPFPYLFDDAQEAARSYGAACTPDFFMYDADRTLVYQGRFDATRPGQGTSDGADLRAAVDELLASGTITRAQHPSMGCSIKWKPGHAPL